MVTWIVGGLVLAIIVSVVGEFFIELAKEKGFYKNPSAKAANFLDGLTSITANWWFAVVFGLIVGGAIFMWADYFLRRRGSRDTEESAGTLTSEQVEDLYTDIMQTRVILDASGDDLTHEGFHEAASLSIKLMNLGIPTPFLPSLRDHVKHETFNGDFCNYLAAISPYVRTGDTKRIRHFAKSAIDVLYVNQPRETDEPTSVEAEHETGRESRWPKTSDYDLPIKLKVIDDLLDIVGSEKEWEQLCRKGDKMAMHWGKHFLDDGPKKFEADLEAYRLECVSMLEKIYGIRRDNEKYQDIWTITEPKLAAGINKQVRDFMEAIRNVGDPPSGNFDFFVSPYAERLREYIREFGAWRFELEKSLFERRKELSS